MVALSTKSPNHNEPEVEETMNSAPVSSKVEADMNPSIVKVCSLLKKKLFGSLLSILSSSSIS